MKRRASGKDLRLAVEAHHTAAGMGPDVLGEAEFRVFVDETVEEAVDDARFWPVGAVVGRRLDNLHRRSLTTGS